MIIEDEMNAARYCSLYISSYGHQFVVSSICKNAAEARDLFRKYLPEVIFCDIRLGKDNGLKLLEEFRIAGWTGYIVIMSGYKDFSYVREAIHLNIEDYLPKPIFPEDVAKVLGSVAMKIERETSGIGIESCLVKGWKNNFPDFIIRALDYVTLNYVERISLTDAACYACVSAAYLSTGFKKYTGYTFIEYVNMYRIEVAKKLLLETNQLLEQVADQVGINDVIYFNKLFKRFTGSSPGRFRKALSGLDKTVPTAPEFSGDVRDR
ncbi:MAG: helix-turn-helix domain-containing protein [Treponema sp.]|jgi:YesN/AraC family two-component response regulator|nr:helix-turn-helix domain-containing protein [Treponema sp.]